MNLQSLFLDESCWTKGNYTKNKNGANVGIFDESCCSWCLLGAINKCYNKPERQNCLEVVEKVKEYLEKTGFTGTISAFNDSPGTNFDDILNLIRALDI